MGGRSGVGRRTAVSLVAFMHQITLYTPNVSRNYGVKQFKNDLKNVRIYVYTQIVPLYSKLWYCMLTYLNICHITNAAYLIVLTTHTIV